MTGYNYAPCARGGNIWKKLLFIGFPSQDSLEHHALLIDFLHEEGYNIYYARDFSEARDQIRVANNIKKPFHACVAPTELPDSEDDGFTFYRGLKTEGLDGAALIIYRDATQAQNVEERIRKREEVEKKMKSLLRLNPNAVLLPRFFDLEVFHRALIKATGQYRFY